MTRALPSRAKIIRMQRILGGLHAFNVLDIARIMHMSTTNARRYITTMYEMGVVEPFYWGRGSDGRYFYYRIRRKQNEAG